MYSVIKFDESTYMVVKDNGSEFCTCSDFEGAEGTAKHRADYICSALNDVERAKFITLDMSEDYGKGSYGVNSNDLSEDDYNGINVWSDLGDAVSEKDELVARDVAGDWAVFALIEIVPETTITVLDENNIDN